MMKYLMIVLFFFLISFSVFGQIKKGNTAISGTATLNIELDDNTGVSFFLSPSWGKFVTDKLLINANLGLSLFNDNVLNNWSISLGPSMRYYFSVNEKVSPFAITGIQYSYQDFESGFFESSHGYIAFGGGGLSFHLNDHITLDGRLVYWRSDTGPFDPSNSIRFLFGFSMFLDNKSE